MELRFYNRIILVITLVLCAFSCSSDLDFNQAEDFNIKPAYSTNLAHFKANAADFVIGGIEVIPPPYTADVDFFNNSYVQNYLVGGNLYFTAKNTINREFTIKIELKDAGNTVIKSILINVPASPSESVISPPPLTVPFDASLKETTQIVFTIITTGSEPPLTVISSGTVELSSSITADFDVK